MVQAGNSQSQTPSKLPSRWQKLSRVLSILLVLTGCWLAVANVWTLSRLSRRGLAAEKRDTSQEIPALEKQDWASSPFGFAAGDGLLEGSWQFAGSPLVMGIRHVSVSDPSVVVERALLAPICEQLDLTLFVEELGRLGIMDRPQTSGDPTRRFFEIDSTQFSAWLVVARSGQRWKFCAGGFAEKDRNASGKALQFEAVATGAEIEAGAVTSLLDLPFETELIGRRFDSQNRLVATLLAVPLPQQDVRAALEKAGLEVRDETAISTQDWSASITPAGQHRLIACRLIQLSPSRCVIMLAKEPNQ